MTEGLESTVNDQDVSTAQPSEKMVRQTDVNSIVHERTKAALAKGDQQGYERARQEFSAQPQHSSQNFANSLSREEIAKLVQEEAAKSHQDLMQRAIYQSQMNDFTQKMLSGGKNYSDFEDVVAPLNLPSMPEVVQLANSMPNTADVMYDLGKNPHKIANILTLAQRNPALAHAEMQRLSQSIANNKVAEDKAKQQIASEPLSQVRPSTVGMDNGGKTVRDYRSQSWLKV